MKLKRIILLLLTVMFLFLWRSFCERWKFAEKGFENQVFDWRVSEHTSKFR